MARPPSTKTLVDRQLGRNTKQEIIPAGESFIVPNHSGDHSEGRVDSTPIEELDIVNKKYVDDQATRNNIELFLTNNASDIGSYKDLEIDVITAAEETITQAITASSTTLIASFASILNEDEIDNLELLESGIYGLHLHASSNFPNNMQFYYEFYHRTAGGTETLLGTSHDSDRLTTSELEYNVHASITTDKAFVSGDRIVVKVYGRNGNNVSKNITINMEGDTASRIEFPAFIAPGFVPTHAASHETGGDDLLTIENIPTSLTAGSIAFSDGTNLTQDNLNLFWNNASQELQPNRIRIEADGTQANPALKFNDTNTGFYKSGDSVRFSLNNSTKMIIDVTGLNMNTHKIVGVVDPTANQEAATKKYVDDNIPTSLTDNSMADTLHRHSELSASDGTPDAQLTLAADGKVGIGNSSPAANTLLHVGAGTDGPSLGGTNIYLSNAGDGYFGARDSTSNIEVIFGTNSSSGGLMGTRTNHGYFFQIGGANIAGFTSAANFGVGTTAPSASTKLEINSTTGALLLPRMTTTQRNTLTAINGMLIYNTTNNVIEGYENGSWVNI